MKINPFRPYRPATCSGKLLRPAFLIKRDGESFWTKVKRRLFARKAAQKAAREKRGHGLSPDQIPTAAVLRKAKRSANA